MDINNNNQTDTQPVKDTPEQTEYFTKFPNRFYKADWFNEPNYLLVFMHLL